MKKILISIPTYNEVENIRKLCQKIFNLKINFDVIIIDDNSPDGTSEVVIKLKKKYKNLILKQRKEKKGLGSALRFAMKYAFENNYDILITLDADLSHRPEEIPLLLKEIRNSDFVIGSRYMIGGKSNYEGYRDLVSKIANKACKFLLQIPLNEFTTSFRAYNKKCLKVLNNSLVKSDGYSSQIEFVFYIHRENLKCSEVPINFQDRYKGNSKIPKLQIIYGALKLMELFLKKIFSIKIKK